MFVLELQQWARPHARDNVLWPLQGIGTQQATIAELDAREELEDFRGAVVPQLQHRVRAQLVLHTAQEEYLRGRVVGLGREVLDVAREIDGAALEGGVGRAPLQELVARLRGSVLAMSDWTPYRGEDREPARLTCGEDFVVLVSPWAPSPCAPCASRTSPCSTTTSHVLEADTVVCAVWHFAARAEQRFIDGSHRVSAC